MEQLKKIGNIKPKASREIKYSKIGIGFEKLDRDAFDPEKAYDKIAETGVKLARIQSGWEKTEKIKGVYDFDWIESIIDNLLARGIEPWVCLCYGNPLYSEMAKTYFGSVGCPPIFSDEEKLGWENYVKAFTEKFKDRVRYYEIWNEPDGQHCWKHGVNAVELGEFSIATAKAVKSVYPEAKVIGGAVYGRNLAFMNTALKTGMWKYIDFISFHEYTHDERGLFERTDTYRALFKAYNPEIGLVQGESGSQSRSGGHGALHRGAWTEEIQAKQLARHTITDLLTDVHFLSYFSSLDMKEALKGINGDKDSYRDFGYFGVLGADFDENGTATGDYYRKKSFYALQNICSIFAEGADVCTIPAFIYSNESKRKMSMQPRREELTTGGFERENGKAFVYWYPSNIMTTSYMSSITLEIYSESNDFRLVDVMDGSIYELPPEMIIDMGDGVYMLNELPIKDTPLILTMGDFIK